MDHIAIDLGGMKSQVCVRSSDGKIVRESRVATRQLGRMLELHSKGRVILETCAEAFTVADAALAAGHEVRVVPATLVRTLGVGARRTKTDARDAQVLSEVSCRIDLPSVHIPKSVSRDRKSMCGMREALVTSRTQLINTVRGWLRTQLRSTKIRSGATETFARRVRESFPALPTWAERQLVAIENLNKLIAEADEELKQCAEADSTCRRLKTVPGVGPLTAIRFVAALDEHDRFADAHKVEAYLGLTPGEDSSSERQRRTSITKAGSAALRRTLIQAAWAARRSRGTHSMLIWANEVEKRRGKRVAAVALARKMAGILFAIWRDGTDYSPRFGITKTVTETGT
jgi:transposase